MLQPHKLTLARAGEGDGLLNVWTRAEYFDVDKFVDAFGNCPPKFLQGLFTLLRPVSNLIEKPINFYEHMHEEKFLDDFLTTESWLNNESGHIGLAIGGRAQREVWPQACAGLPNAPID